MIKIDDEALMPLAEAARKLPPRRLGRPVNITTIYRWARVGIRGIRLETIQVGGGRCTSVQALQRFFNRLSASDPNQIPRLGYQPQPLVYAAYPHRVVPRSGRPEPAMIP